MSDDTSQNKKVVIVGLKFPAKSMSFRLFYESEKRSLELPLLSGTAHQPGDCLASTLEDLRVHKKNEAVGKNTRKERQPD
jgi:hypothetical protein